MFELRRNFRTRRGESRRLRSTIVLHRSCFPMWRGLPFAVAVQLASAILPPPPPPPPPLPPGIGCSGETIFTSSTGSHTVTFDTDLVTTLPGGTATLDCAFVILTPNVTQGLLINFTTFDLDIGGPCVGAGTYLDVYDHTTNLETMLAHLTCRLAPPIASTNGSAMLLFRTVINTTGTFTFTWAPASPSCGNGICENSADEYDLCMQDCNMSSFVLEHANTMWCEDYDRLVATTVLGASISIPYTLSHFGPGLPPGGLTVDLANILPADACSEVTSVTRSANITTRPIGERPKRPHPQLPHPKAPAAPLLRCKCRTPFSAAIAAPPSPLQLPHPLLAAIAAPPSRCNLASLTRLGPTDFRTPDPTRTPLPALQPHRSMVRHTLRPSSRAISSTSLSTSSEPTAHSPSWAAPWATHSSTCRPPRLVNPTRAPSTSRPSSWVRRDETGSAPSLWRA